MTIHLDLSDRARVGDAATATVTLLISAGDGVGEMPSPTTVSAALTLISPFGTVSPSARPVFVVGIDTDTPNGIVEIQYGAGADLTGAPSVGVPAPAGQSGAQVAVQADADLPDGVTYWRARYTALGGSTAWTAAAQFAVNSIEGDAQLTGSWTIDAGAAPATHLWYIDHDETGNDSGGTGILLGTGFGAAPQVFLGDLPCDVTEVLEVPDAAAQLGRRAIEPGVCCTPWHTQITFVIPDVDPDHPGDALTVIGGR